MTERIGARVRVAYGRVDHFFNQEIWNAQLVRLPPKQARRYRAARVLYSVLRGLVIEDTLHVRAAALTYYTVLSLVPLLAFVFAMLKGFGAYDLLVQETIRPYIHDTLSGNDALQSGFERILDFVDATGVTSLGFIGLLTLLYTATRLLRNVERALNELWGTEASRDHIQQFRDYIAIIVVTPLCMMAAAALTTFGQALDYVRAAGQTLGVDGVLDHVIGALGPLIALFMGLMFLYKAMPFVIVQVKSAAIGAAIGAVVWYLMLIVHVRFQVGVARFNALYSGFAAVPIFLAWLQVSWLVVLVGALIAATHQNAQSIAEKMRTARLDAALRESLCIAAVLRIAQAFIQCDPPVRRRELGSALHVPELLLSDLLGRLEQALLVAQTGPPSDPSYVLARPPASIRLKDILDALRHAPDPRTEAMRAALVDQPAERLWHALDDALARTPENCALSEVLDQTCVPKQQGPA